jgi:hypothetical protein
MEEELSAGLREGQITQFVEDNEVHAGEVIGHPALPSGSGLGLETIDQIDGVEEPSARSIADTGPRDTDGKIDGSKNLARSACF